jgi:cytochrome c peroxidase
MLRRSILVFGIVSLVVIGFSVSAQAGDPFIRDIMMKALGGLLFSDKNLSLNSNQSCKSCHHPDAKFADPDNANDPVNKPVSDGSITGALGGRNAPTASYAAFIPKLFWDGELYIGGMFWDARASGLATSATAKIGAGPTFDPLADQAKGPFLNPLEMAMPDEDSVVARVRSADYAWMYRIVFPGALQDTSIQGIKIAYDNIALAIAAFEKSVALNKFNSRFDKFVAEQGGDVGKFGIKEIFDNEGNLIFRKYAGPPKGFKSKYFSYQEADGLALFNADSETQLGAVPGLKGNNVGGMCYLCHITERHNPDYGPSSTMPPNPFRADGTYPPLLSDFSYDNLGIPKSTNPLIAGNPVDYGLGDASRVAELATLNPVVVDYEDGPATFEKGKFKVSSLRNLAKTAPYAHNGYFATMKEIVHFYNTRDALPKCEELGITAVEGVNCWPTSEVPDTVNGDELGNLGLSGAQEDKIVAFLKTLSDN